MGRKSKLPGPSELWTLYHEKGLSLQEIGDEYGVTREAVRQAMEKYGFARRTQKEAQALVKGRKPPVQRPSSPVPILEPVMSEPEPTTEVEPEPLAPEQEEDQFEIYIHT